LFGDDLLDAPYDPKEPGSVRLANIDKAFVALSYSALHGSGKGLLSLAELRGAGRFQAVRDLAFTPVDNSDSKITDELVEELFGCAQDALAHAQESGDCASHALDSAFEFISDAAYFGIMSWMCTVNSTDECEVDAAAGALLDIAEFGALHFRSTHGWRPVSKHGWFTFMLLDATTRPKSLVKDRLLGAMAKEYSTAEETRADGTTSTTFTPAPP
jgi:hypothetical protein